jgi:NAD(P)-dependent dehydrogenase (short-subunit alcohol dehydrogenase family)
MALGFARAGADIVVSSRKKDACELVVDEVRALGRRAAAIACHVGHWSELDAFFEACREFSPTIDILVNNAGLSPIAPSSLETDEGLVDHILNVNFKGPFRLCALFGSLMAERGKGAIINVSSAGALRPSPWVAPYAGAKAALHAASVAFSQEYGPRGVRVNVISPGPFLTDASRGWRDDERRRRMVALQRFGDPDEIVSTALYLATSSFTNGANIVVDGGGPMLEGTA